MIDNYKPTARDYPGDFSCEGGMTDWEIKLNQNIERVKNNPDEIKKLIKEYIKEMAETILERIYNEKYYTKSIISDMIEWELFERDINDYNTDLFNQY